MVSVGAPNFAHITLSTYPYTTYPLGCHPPEQRVTSSYTYNTIAVSTLLIRPTYTTYLYESYDLVYIYVYKYLCVYRIYRRTPYRIHYRSYYRLMSSFTDPLTVLHLPLLLTYTTYAGEAKVSCSAEAGLPIYIY